ncbi:AAA family ATPase [Shewanella profunda]|uniref:AAA family ATPase n=1 Tax=Shewanella profunda TaxID=254793 RepID=UPI00200E06BE|nr:AAA family ATPase [Shewanella profunda]MCL1091080.1 AAA family ATPase [Shewanella profunda]
MMEENQKLEVIFCESKGISASPLAGQVLIRQSSDWNDFGYNINATYKLCMWDRQTVLEGELLVGFLPKVKKNLALEDIDKEHFELLGSIDKALKYQSSGEDFIFFTHFPNLQEYRKVVLELGVKGTEKLLKSINNILLIDNFTYPKGLYEKIVESNVFSRAFMRKSESFFAFHNADSIIKGIEFENYSAISNSFSLGFKLNGFENSHKIDFKFDSKAFIPSRISVLIGKNGLGKSQSLNKLCRALLKRPEPNTTQICTNESGLKEPMINRLLALVSPGEASSTFPGEYARRQKLYYRKIDLNSSSGANNKSIGDLFEQLLRSQNYIRESYRINIFKEALSKAIDIKSLYLKITDTHYIPVEKLRFVDGFTEQDLKIAQLVKSCKIPVVKVADEYYPLSSGQLTYFQFTLQCCLYIENGTLIVLDEPETHMHPNFIGEFVELLDYLLEHTGSFSIIATHSPYFVREVGRKQVHIFSTKDDGFIDISTPRLRTFGADVESISQFVFNEDIENRLTDKIFKKIRHRTFESVAGELGDELSLGALMDLKSRFEA